MTETIITSKIFQYSTLGQYLRAARESISPALSQHALSLRTNVTRATINSIENEKTHPMFETAFILISYLRSCGAPPLDIYKLKI